MKFDVLELYELYQDKPETFAPILRNVNGSEIRRLVVECRHVNGLIDHCNVEGHMPWEDIYGEAEKLVAEFEDSVSFFQCFRKIDMGEYLSADEIVTKLEVEVSLLKDSCQNFENGMSVIKGKVGRSAASEDDVEVEYRELSTPLHASITTVIETLEELDKAI